MAAAFTSGIVLLLNIWGAKKSGMQSDPAKQMQDVHKCMQHLKDVENRFRSAGRLWDILYELASVGELPLPQPSPPGNSHKRERDSDTPITASRASNTLPLPSDVPTIAAPRPLAKSRATAASRSASASGSAAPSVSNSTPPPPIQAPMSVFNSMQHPVTSVDLGRMPLNPDVGYTPQDPLNPITWTYNLTSGIPESDYRANAGHPHAPHQSRHAGYPDQGGHGSLYSLYSAPTNQNQGIPFQSETYTPGQMGLANLQAQHSTYGNTDQHHAPSGAEVEFMGGMWSNAPASFEYDDWGNWVSSGIDPATGLMAGVAPDQEMQNGQQHGLQ